MVDSVRAGRPVAGFWKSFGGRHPGGVLPVAGCGKLTSPLTDAKQLEVQNVTARSQPAELTSARANAGILVRKSSMFLICFSRRKDRVTRAPGNTTSLLPS